MGNKIDIARRVEELTTSCLNELRNLTPENFESNFHKALSNLKEARALKNSIVTEDMPLELNTYLKRINSTTKLISEEYDNIIRKYSKEIDNTIAAIRTASIKRKLASYSKGEL